MKNKILILLIQLFLNIKIINSSERSEIAAHLILNLKEERNEIKDLSESDYIKEMMYNNFYSKFNLGIPAQRLKFYYETNIYEISIAEEEYDKIKSTTYKLIDNKYKNISNDKNDFILKDPNGYLSQENFEICPEITLNNFTFLLKGKNETKEKNGTNIIGLSLQKNKSINNSLSFLNQLKQKNYIDKKIFSFLFEDDMISARRGIDGQILIGCLPHELNVEFEEKDLKWISLNKNKNDKDKDWHINFDIVKYNNDELKDKKVYFDLSLNLIIGPENFRKKLIEVFFGNRLEKKICIENYFYNIKDEQFYIYYSCSTEAEFIEIPNLSFYNKELNEIFNISFYDLFTSYKHRFYLNIIFKKNPQNNWIFGQLFFKSYRFVFDLEQEKIGYYKTYQNKQKPIIAIIALSIVFLSFGIAYIFYLNNNKKDNNGNDNYIYQNISYPIRSEYSNNSNTNINNKDSKNNDINKKNSSENNNKGTIREKQD